MNETTYTCEVLQTKELFAPGNSEAWSYISQYTMPWEAIAGIGDFIRKYGEELSESEYTQHEGEIWIHKTAKVAQSAYIGTGVIIGALTEVRHGAYIRENAFVGRGAVVGNSTELKNVILFDDVQVPHYNYVGDSILGYKAHLGAGAVTSNVKADKSDVTVICGCQRCETGLRKFGAILADGVEVGCNSVLNPGSVIGPGTLLYPLSFVRGYVPGHSIYKQQGILVQRK